MHSACVHNDSFLAVKWQRCARERESKGSRKCYQKVEACSAYSAHYWETCYAFATHEGSRGTLLMGEGGQSQARRLTLAHALVTTQLTVSLQCVGRQEHNTQATDTIWSHIRAYLSVWWCRVDVLGQASPGWQVLPHLIYDWLPEKERQWRHKRFSEKLRDFPIRGTNGPKRRCKIKLCGQNYFYPVFWKKVCKIKRCISVYKYFLWGC